MESTIIIMGYIGTTLRMNPDSDAKNSSLLNRSDRLEALSWRVVNWIPGPTPDPQM